MKHKKYHRKNSYYIKGIGLVREGSANEFVLKFLLITSVAYIIIGLFI